MRYVTAIILLFSASSLLAQNGYWRYSIEDHKDSYDSYIKYYTLKYPYTKGYAPPFLGLVVGYNFETTQEVEIGFAYNLLSESTVFGATGGYQLLYRRSLKRDLNAIDLELGIYGLITLGIGANYNFSNEASAFGFKPFIGTSIYHFQLVYGYNFLRKTKVDWYGLPQHSIRIRYLLPLIAKKNGYIEPAPAPYYRYLRGLHKDHPLQKNVENQSIRRDIQLR